MMLLNTVLIAFLATISIIVMAYFIIDVILVKYKRKTATTDFTELLTILAAVVKSELELYETDVFSTKKSITNSNFDNFYNDLTHRIIDNLSDNFMDQITVYVTEEMVVSYIARSVKIYLTTKINGTS